MSQPADFVVDNASGAAVRTDLNNIFDAISINNGFGSEPTTKYKYMWFADDTISSPKMSFYKANASSKIDFISLTDGSFFGPNGTASNPSYTFTNSINTGFYRSADNEIGVSNNGTNTALFKVGALDIKGHINVEPTSGEAFVQLKTGVNNEEAYVDFVTDTTTYTDYGLRLQRGNSGVNTDSSLMHRGTGQLRIMTEQAAPISFRTSSTERWQIDLNGAFVWKQHTGNSVTLNAGTILARALTSRKGTLENASVANAYNFYWDDSGEGTGKANHLEAWVDTNFVGDVTLGVSDYRIKDSVALQTESGINKVKNLKPITYKYKEYGVLKASDEIREGFLAHEVQEVIPSAVNREKDVENSLQTLNLDAIVSVLTKALQEAVAKIETLETKVAALEGS